MKLCLILVVVAGFATACARTEQQQTTDTQQPASAPPDAPPRASVRTTGARTTRTPAGTADAKTSRASGPAIPRRHDSGWHET